MNEIFENIKQVKQKIAEAAISVGRAPEEVTLVAATKMNDADRVKQAVAGGIDVAGENRVQELMDKYDKGAYEGVPLHFIGTLQTNKVKYLVGKVDLIQSVDSLKLVKEISRVAAKRGICQDILIEINIGGEESKSGISPSDLEEFIEEISKMNNVRVRGLMTIPPILSVGAKNEPYFRKMKELFVDISGKKYDNISMDILSMGMSSDFEEAIRCGATMVRVGTGIFGARHYS